MNASNQKPKPPPQDQMALGILKNVPLIYDGNGVYVDAAAKGYRNRLLLVPSADFVEWLSGQVYTTYKSILDLNIVKKIIPLIRMTARTTGIQSEVHKRFAFHDDKLYIDIGDDTFGMVEVAPGSWKITTNTAVYFHRSKTVLPLATPDPTGDPFALFDLINIKDKGQQLLVLVWLCASVIGNIQRPMLLLIGKHHSGKTMAGRILRSLFDNNAPLELSVGTKEDDVVLNLFHNAIPFFDNLSPITKAISGKFCTAVTGAGYAKRILYTDMDQISITYQRPIILTAIDVPSQEEDFQDRLIRIPMGQIGGREMVSEREVVTAFEQKRGAILGGLLNALSRAMRMKGNLNLAEKSRFGDFEEWGAAISIALGCDPDAFMEAMGAAKKQLALDKALKDPVIRAIDALLVGQPGQQWAGSTTELFSALEPYEPEFPSGYWPSSAEGLGKKLPGARAGLSELGISVSEPSDKNSGRIRTIVKRQQVQKEYLHPWQRCLDCKEFTKVPYSTDGCCAEQEDITITSAEAHDANCCINFIRRSGNTLIESSESDEERSSPQVDDFDSGYKSVFI